jgi:hypothetical protein
LPLSCFFKTTVGQELSSVVKHLQYFPSFGISIKKEVHDEQATVAFGACGNEIREMYSGGYVLMGLIIVGSVGATSCTIDL